MGSGFLVATFTRPETLLRAVRPVRGEGFRVYDVHAPYPIHGLDRAMGLRRTRLPLVTLVAGLAGLTFAVLFQVYTTSLDWPLNVGGKPDNSALAFVPVSFELTVLLAGLGTAAAFFLRARLYPGKRERLPAAGVTDDRFALVVRRPDNELEVHRACHILRQLGADTVEEQS
jgi:hypothetical protein